MAARRAGLPLWRLLDDSGTGVGLVRVYASDIVPQDVVDLALAKQAQGYAAFKLKVGFAADVDRRNLADLRAALGPQAEIMIDAYQAWSPGDVVTRIAALADLEPLWVEEPIAADEDAAHWRQLANECGLALAAGENLRGEAAFTQAVDADYLRY